VLLLRALLLLLMATFVQKTDDGGTSTAGPTAVATQVWGGNPANGNANLVGIFWKGAVTITSVTDTQGNGYADCGAGKLARPTDGFLQIFGAFGIIGGTTPTVTVNFSAASATEIDVYLNEYHPAAGEVLSFDSVTSSATATSGNSITTGNLTPTVTSGIVFAFGGANSDHAAAGSGFTIRSTFTIVGGGTEDQIFSSSIGTITPSMTWGGAAMTKGGLLVCVVKAVSARVPTDLQHSRQWQALIAQ
jgi:hypothetical protein